VIVAAGARVAFEAREDFDLRGGELRAALGRGFFVASGEEREDLVAASEPREHRRELVDDAVIAGRSAMTPEEIVGARFVVVGDRRQ